MSLFTRLPVTISNQTLPLVSEADVQYLVDYEPTSYDHWIFDKGGVAGLTGRNQGKLLTPQSDAPAYSGAHLTLNTASGKALLTDLEDSAAPQDTICAIFRPQVSAGMHFPFGCLGETGNNTGGGPYLQGTEPSRNIFLTYRINVASAVNTGVPVAGGNWYFLAVSRNFAAGAGAKALTMLLGGQSPYVLSNSLLYGRAASPRKQALGNPYYAAAGAGSMDFAEFVVFNKALSAAELAAVYARSKARMAARGITVV